MLRSFANATGTHVAIGLTSKCPYGLGACWGGAFDALVKLDGVSAVRPIANAKDSVADVYLHGDTLPDVDRWHAQIQQSANGSYDVRGVELSVTGTLHAEAGLLTLSGPLFRAPLRLEALGATPKVQFDRTTGKPQSASAEEQNAFARLAALTAATGNDRHIRVTGPLTREAATWALHVRAFENLPA